MIGPQWLESISEALGLDPLGIQAISINIYGILLPGMTNVTNRLRYYSFLCWILDNYSKTIKSRKLEDWQNYVRKSEFLIALITEFHHKEEKGFSTGMVGSRKTGHIIRNESEDPIDLTKYTGFEYSSDRYFQNKGGGFAQYYKGPMRELKLIVNGGPLGIMLADSVTKSNEQRFGVKAAGAFSHNKNLGLFHDCVIKGKVARSQLKELTSSLCACKIDENIQEKSLLTNLLFDFDNNLGQSGERRRKTLSLILNLINNYQHAGISIEDFRNICFYKYYPDGGKINIPENLYSTLNMWSIYQTHEYFCFALLCFFYIFEKYIRKGEYGLNDLFELIKNDLSDLRIDQLEYLNQLKSLDLIKKTNLEKFFSDLVLLNSDEPGWFSNNYSEHYFKGQINKHIKDENLAPLILIGMIVLGKLYLKNLDSPNFYDNLKIFLTQNYKIHINYLIQTVHEFLNNKKNFFSLVERILKEFIIERHTIVALRKLRYEKKSTLRFVIDNNQFSPTQSLRLDVPIFTNPRLGPAFRFLEDLNLIIKADNTKYILTQEGQTITEKINGL